jgi:pyrroline-5-carboxylate reductase
VNAQRVAVGCSDCLGACTIDGILELEEGKLRVTLIKAVVKATLRAGELLFEK